MEIVATAIFIKDSKVLLEKRREDEDNYAGLWTLPGGHKKKDETMEQALKREMDEELKVKIIKARFIGKFKDIDPTSHRIYEHNAFLCLEWQGKIEETTEQSGVKWFEIEEIKNLKKLNPVDIKILKKAKVI